MSLCYRTDKKEMQEKNPKMTLFLKIFWAAMAFILLAGFATLAVVGIPSPSVDVKKKIPIEKLIQK